jgi:5-methylcytosine-specific restriction endonuclease McrA
MPIRRELRRFYGAEWRAYRATLIALAGGKCLECGRPHAMLNGAHMTHDPRDMALVMVLCPSCHAKHDAPHRVAMMRRNRAKRVGQLWLLPEIEWAPYASWMIPRRVIAGAQERLF